MPPLLRMTDSIEDKKQAILNALSESEKPVEVAATLNLTYMSRLSVV